MIFSSPVFLFLFLPLVLAVALPLTLASPRARNAFLLLASLFFYAWGETEIVLVMLASITVNYVLGRLVDRARETGRGKGVVAFAVAFNIGLLVVFKYSDWLWGSGIQLPIGISFFTFQALSYVVDVYRGEARVQRSPVAFGTYIALFPQLIAGPIVRYRDIAEQLGRRGISIEGFAYGVRRFTIGLAKKVLIANVTGKAADHVFGLPEGQLGTGTAWLGIVCYAIQIYFDFSGYSDMAIGLARMFGFRLLENFRYPYVALSITEFWRRWHISLSSWFRDYLYIPLGGNRRGRACNYRNLVVVFLLCGLWHGAAWTFVAWGAFHGSLLVLERVGLGRLIERAPRVVRHAYTLLAVLVGWVYFRADSFGDAHTYLGAMFGFAGEAAYLRPPAFYLDAQLALVLLAGIVGSVPWLPRVIAWRRRIESEGRRAPVWALELCGHAFLVVMLLGSTLELAAGTYNPFIYFRF